MSEAAAEEPVKEGEEGKAVADDVPEAPQEGPKVVHVEAAHRAVDITLPPTAPEYAKLGYFITWTCADCGIGRVPGAPFVNSGDKRIFLSTCTFGDTSRVCCNCERNKELLTWRGRTLQVMHKGPKLLDPPIRIVDVETMEVVWEKVDGDKASMEAYREIVRESFFVSSNSERTRWYSEMACNHCRHRVGLKTHEEVARDKAIADHMRILEASSKGKKKGKKKK